MEPLPYKQGNARPSVADPSSAEAAGIAHTEAAVDIELADIDPAVDTADIEVVAVPAGMVRTVRNLLAHRARLEHLHCAYHVHNSYRKQFQ